MYILHYTCASPEENIALEEYLFLKLCDDDLPEILRIWESDVYFVVVGSSQCVEEEVYVEDCMAEGIKIIRRCSAGGTVLQGPGCLNFTLCIRIDNRPEFRNIRESYRIILGRLSEVLRRRCGIFANQQGISDLCVEGRKVSGNAQRRNSKVLLHHGTLLYSVNYGLMEKLLKIPKIQPEYRQGRSHTEFVGSLPLDRREIIQLLVDAFNGNEQYFLSDEDFQGLKQLTEQKYSTHQWNFRY